MKKRIIACLLCVFCLLSAVGCTSSAPAEAAVSETTASETMVTESPTVEATAAAEGSASGDYLSSIGGTYVELFPELSKPEYRQIWIDAVTPLIGAENAEATTDMLLGMCMAGIYGPEATEKYAADPNSMAFDCYFLGGVKTFVIDGHTITGLDDQGKEVFSHTYDAMNVDNENGFIFYKSQDEDSGQFSYFAFSPDSMDTTYHLEFRYAQEESDLQSWFEGNFAYWNAAAIAADDDQPTMENVINLFAQENLAGQE